MKREDCNADIVVTVSGGLVTGVFGPAGASILLLDFDNIRQGSRDIGVSTVDGTPDSKACRASVGEALDLIERRG